MLFVLSFIYVVNQVDRYLLAVVSKPLEQDVGFGYVDDACFASLVANPVLDLPRLTGVVLLTAPSMSLFAAMVKEEAQNTKRSQVLYSQ